MELSRDIFLIGCYTGQRVSDFNGLSSDDIFQIEDNSYFKITQKKTKQVVYCPITKEIQEIMSRYGNKPPPFQRDTIMNQNIKIIGKLLNFNEKTRCESTKGGKRVKEYLSKYEMIHTHTARRSFCTNMYKRGMPMADIMHFSGHKTEREFQKYIRIFGQERTNHIVGQGFFNM